MAQPCLPMGPFPNKLTEKESRRARVTIWEFFLKFFFFFQLFHRVSSRTFKQTARTPLFFFIQACISILGTLIHNTHHRPMSKSESQQLRVRLVTRDTDYAVSDAPILVPVALKRYGLSEVVNQLLQQQREADEENDEEYKHVPFEFLVDGELLRSSLDDTLTAKGLSTEAVLTLEYTRAVLPPSYLASYSHPDWVAAVDIFQPENADRRYGKANPQDQGVAIDAPIATGSYDGVVRLWSRAGRVSHQLLAHNAAVKAVKWTAQDRLVSASADRTLCLWKTTLPDAEELLGADEEPTLNANSSIVALLRGHTAAVNNVAVNHLGNIVSASADGTLRVWNTNYKSLPQYEAPVASTSTATQKRRRIAAAALPAARTRTSAATLSGHSSAVEAVVFHARDAQTVHSVGQDHTIRTWDLAAGAQIDVRTTQFPLLAISTLSELGLLACGSSARHITLHDPRAGASATLTQATLVGHTNFVVDLAPSPVSPYMLASASHDGTARVWDVRAQKCLYVLPRQSGQKGPGGVAAVFGVDWDKDVGIVSCGKDKQLQINSSTQF